MYTELPDDLHYDSPCTHLYCLLSEPSQLRTGVQDVGSVPFSVKVDDGIIRHFQYLSRCIVPRSVLEAKVLQATTCFHDRIPNPVLQETDFILHDSVAFHSPNRVFNTDSDGGNTTIRRLLRGREFSSRRCFLGLDDGDVMQPESLEALILVQAATSG